MAKKQDIMKKAVEEYEKMMKDSARELASHRIPCDEEENIKLNVTSIQSKSKQIEVVNDASRINTGNELSIPVQKDNKDKGEKEGRE